MDHLSTGRDHLSAGHFPPMSGGERAELEADLAGARADRGDGDMFALLSRYQRALADNAQRARWPGLHRKLRALFMAGEAVPVDGPMIGMPVAIRDSDHFESTARLFGRTRSLLAGVEWMATAWNATFADTGLWMGKTFEAVGRDAVAACTEGDRVAVASYDAAVTRIGRNFFREPPDPSPFQSLGLPVLTEAWDLEERPTLDRPHVFDATLSPEHAEKERYIPYTMTGGRFLADMGRSVLADMGGKPVFQLNYRWPPLGAIYPNTRLVDEIVQIGDGIYLGQLVLATHHYALATVDADEDARQLGEDYVPHPEGLARLWRFAWQPTATFGRLVMRPVSTARTFLDEPWPFVRSVAVRAFGPGGLDYGYQNNGYFLMMDPAYAERVYADDVFPQLRPRPGEAGYRELGFHRAPPGEATRPTGTDPRGLTDWASGWQEVPALAEKFTTLLSEPSPLESDPEPGELLREGESVLQMLQRLSEEISAQTKPEDDLCHFEALNRLFRAGVPPRVEGGLLRRHRQGAYNTRLTGKEPRPWYGVDDPCLGFDYYHGATLNLHCGLGDTFSPDRNVVPDERSLLPGMIAARLLGRRGPNLLNEVWHHLGRYVFPWAGKSFETISGRRLSMLVDESDDLAERYPERVGELRRHLASAPHYLTLRRDAEHYWARDGEYAPYLASGPWDGGMEAENKAFWAKEASERWVYGTNVMDRRILAGDLLMRIADMNYRAPDPYIQAITDAGPSPFVRQGYVFLGVAGEESILPMNAGKQVFQFRYRYPMIGGPAPIGYCLDETVEIADGLFLGQLIYSTALDLTYHSAVDSKVYEYQLFGYFLLLDDDWQRHRLAIGLDVLD